MIRKIALAVSVAALGLTATACNTVKGLGQDVESVGQTDDDHCHRQRRVEDHGQRRVAGHQLFQPDRLDRHRGHRRCSKADDRRERLGQQADRDARQRHVRQAIRDQRQPP